MMRIQSEALSRFYKSEWYLQVKTTDSAISTKTWIKAVSVFWKITK